ncbi:hypothetical protein E2C01_068992 [Portunus trituberculatus]|uniref:Uncharacterized protein n=1 Tax=Portunus trituberculatus TaxID=210409 RepID=A0A5B7HXQ7_PORTR|nr:hypothetical protein [Portunus trituberculatus]
MTHEPRSHIATTEASQGSPAKPALTTTKHQPTQPLVDHTASPHLPLTSTNLNNTAYMYG